MCQKMIKDTFHPYPPVEANGRHLAAPGIELCQQALQSFFRSLIEVNHPPASAPVSADLSLFTTVWISSSDHTLLFCSPVLENIYYLLTEPMLPSSTPDSRVINCSRKKSHLRRLTFVPDVPTSPVSHPAIDLSQSTDLLALCSVRHSLWLLKILHLLPYFCYLVISHSAFLVSSPAVNPFRNF